MRNITCDDGRGGVVLCYNETGPGTHVEYMCDNSCDLISTESCRSTVFGITNQPLHARLNDVKLTLMMLSF